MRFKFASFALSALTVLSALSVRCEETPEVRIGLREILGESKTTQARLGLVENPDKTDDEKGILDIVRADLSLIGIVEIDEIGPKEIPNFPYPRLELKVVRTQKGVLAHAKILVGRETIASRNIPESSNLRKIGHKLSELILQTLTGEIGFFTSKIAFVLRYKGKKEIWISDWDGKNANPITQWQNVSMLPAFESSGSELVFTSYKDGNPDLYIYNFAAKTFKLVSGVQGLNASASFDPLGEGLAVTLSRNKDPNLYFLSKEGKILRRLTDTPGIDTAAAFSPNGREIAFTTDRSGNPQIFLMSRGGSNIRRLTYGFFWADEADWSRDGNAIAFTAKKARDEKFQVFLADPLGMRFLQLTDEGANEHPVFSPDGRFLAFSSNRNGKWEIFIKGINPETSEIRTVSFQNSDCLEPAWSSPEKG